MQCLYFKNIIEKDTKYEMSLFSNTSNVFQVTHILTRHRIKLGSAIVCLVTFQLFHEFSMSISKSVISVLSTLKEYIPSTSTLQVILQLKHHIQ